MTRMGQAPRRTIRRQLETRPLHPQPAQPHHRRAGTQQASAISSAHYHTGSASCQKCHAQIYEHWRKNPHGQRRPRSARIPERHHSRSLHQQNPPSSPKEDIALVYGSLWKQRYFTKSATTISPSPRSGTITNKVWRPYFVPNGADWWVPFLSSRQHATPPTGPTCDGLPLSVGYDIHTKKVVEWNVGCERCHGPGSEHKRASHAHKYPESREHGVRPASDNLLSSAIPRAARSPARSKENITIGPLAISLGYKPCAITGTSKNTNSANSRSQHFPDGTAHKNRMQGNDFVQSVMYRRGVTMLQLPRSPRHPTITPS